MRQKFITLLFILTFAFTFHCCSDSFDKAMCGEPEGKQKIFIDSINAKYKNELTLRHVPCYNDYMRVDLKASYDKNLIDSLEKAYERQINWAEFQVYDKDNKLIRGNTGSM